MEPSDAILPCNVSEAKLKIPFTRNYITMLRCGNQPKKMMKIAPPQLLKVAVHYKRTPI